jgi:tetratricopeptide (TPR) repeat protein
VPNDIPNITKRIERALRDGDPGTAQSLLRDLIAAHPECAGVWAVDSDVALALGNPARSLASADRAVALGAATTANHLRRARALRRLDRSAEVEPAVRMAALAAGSVALYHARIGDFLTAIEDYPGALVAYEEALRLDPGSPAYLFNRAAVRRFLGNLTGAEADYDRVIVATPDDAEAYLNRSELRTQTPARNHVTELRRELARTGRPWLDEVRLRFALSKELEDQGLYAESWQELEAGATLRRRHLEYDVAVDVATVDWIRAAYSTPVPENTLPTPDGSIFIVGMPRTGSTLLERMLTGHSQVCSAGERHDFAELLVTAARDAAGAQPVDRRRLVAASAAVDFGALGNGYLARIGRFTARRPRVIDKMPLNYLYCGLIRRALPQARILHMTRHPLATCYAIYKMLFNQAYPFSYNLGEIGAYYIAYRRLMDHWRSSVPGQILDVSYEELVLAPEATLRRILAFCALDWEPGCLEFQHRREATSTASASQVRRPIYRGSLDLWRHYTTQLEPLAAQLAAAGIIESAADAAP